MVCLGEIVTAQACKDAVRKTEVQLELEQARDVEDIQDIQEQKVFCNKKDSSKSFGTKEDSEQTTFFSFPLSVKPVISS